MTHKRIIVIILLILCSAVHAIAIAQVEEEKASSKVERSPYRELPGGFFEVLISLNEDGNETAVVDDVISHAGEVVERHIPYLPDIIKVKVHKSNLEKFMQELKKDPNVRNIERVGYFELD